MGWRGTIRSVGAAVRAAERDAQRRRKIALKQQMISEAEDAVNSWEQYIDDLLSIHTNLADEIDWSVLSNEARPREPIKSFEHEAKAQERLKSFKPTLWTKLFGSSAKKLSQLEEAVSLATSKDNEAYQIALAAYDQSLADWQAETELAKRLISNDPQAIIEVIKEYQSLDGHALIGTTINFNIVSSKIHATVLVHSEDIVPSFRRKQLASGKLSQSKMPVGQFNEIYQDYVCSVALKVAGDLFRILPQREVYVTCECEMLDSATGHKRPTAILSVHFVQDTFIKLNLRDIDPSDSMRNFNHEMKFTKTKGFSAVSPLVTVGMN